MVRDIDVAPAAMMADAAAAILLVGMACDADVAPTAPVVDLAATIDDAAVVRLAAATAASVGSAGSTLVPFFLNAASAAPVVAPKAAPAGAAPPAVYICGPFLALIV